MEFLNANSKLINYQMMKNSSTNTKQSSSGNKSMDFTLTLRSDFSMQAKPLEAPSILFSKKSFSNILEDNPASFIKQ